MDIQLFSCWPHKSFSGQPLILLHIVLLVRQPALKSPQFQDRGQKVPTKGTTNSSQRCWLLFSIPSHPPTPRAKSAIPIQLESNIKSSFQIKSRTPLQNWIIGYSSGHIDLSTITTDQKLNFSLNIFVCRISRWCFKGCARIYRCNFVRPASRLSKGIGSY